MFKLEVKEPCVGGSVYEDMEFLLMRSFGLLSLNGKRTGQSEGQRPGKGASKVRPEAQEP